MHLRVPPSATEQSRLPFAFLIELWPAICQRVRSGLRAFSLSRRSARCRGDVVVVPRAWFPG
jgi:hypothetical protein